MTTQRTRPQVRRSVQLDRCDCGHIRAMHGPCGCEGAIGFFDDQSDLLRACECQHFKDTVRSMVAGDPRYNTEEKVQQAVEHVAADRAAHPDPFEGLV